MCVNDDDDDDDRIPDFADGYNLDGIIGNNDDTPAPTEKFVPVIFKIPEPIDIDTALINITYDSSDPQMVTINASGEYILPTGSLRIWTKKGHLQRIATKVVDGGDFVPAGINTAVSLGFTDSNRSQEWYMEATSPSGSIADKRILFEVDPDGEVYGKQYPEFIAADAVRMTVLNVDIVQTQEVGHVYCTNCVPYWLTSDSWTNVTWTIAPNSGTNGAQFTSCSTWAGTGTNEWQGTNVWVYSGLVTNTYTLSACANELACCQDTAIFDVLSPEFLDFDWLETLNETLHHASAYQTNALILRRAQKFNVEAKLSKGYTNTCYDIWFRAVHKFDGTPKTNNVPAVESDLRATDWYCKLLSVANNTDETKTVEIEINIPSTNTPIGEYEWQALISPKVDSNIVLDTTNFPGDVIILFNPWHPDDTVYMATAANRTEYVMRSSGKMWRGSRSSKSVKTWRYAQFKQVTLDVLLSELGGLGSTDRMTPIKVSRHLSAHVNSNGGGILAGRWDGNYAGGTSPSVWSGSDQILNRYNATGSEVKYGQCWVFGGLLTTMLRCAGIPARPITTFDSSHDADGNKDIDYYYKVDGSYDSVATSDSIWNYHVWCDAWMMRPDQTGQNGWQAVDATPQELSSGQFQCGPASHVAVKADSGGNYDVDFVFAEVDADLKKRLKQAGGGYVLVSTDVDATGHDISTMTVGANTRNDITDVYK